MFIHQERDGVEVKLNIVLLSKKARKKSLLLLPHLPAKAYGDLIEIVCVFAQVNRLSFGKIYGHEGDAYALVIYLPRMRSQRA